MALQRVAHDLAPIHAQHTEGEHQNRLGGHPGRLVFAHSSDADPQGDQRQTSEVGGPINDAGPEQPTPLSHHLAQFHRRGRAGPGPSAGKHHGKGEGHGVGQGQA